jgi:hypothetical protein
MVLFLLRRSGVGVCPHTSRQHDRLQYNTTGNPRRRRSPAVSLGSIPFALNFHLASSSPQHTNSSHSKFTASLDAPTFPQAGSPQVTLPFASHYMPSRHSSLRLDIVHSGFLEACPKVDFALPANPTLRLHPVALEPQTTLHSDNGAREIPQTSTSSPALYGDGCELGERCARIV